MISRYLSVQQRRRSAQLADAIQGNMPSVLRFSSKQQAGRAIANPVRLPVVNETPTELQTETGLMFIEGYSDPDGPDEIV